MIFEIYPLLNKLLKQAIDIVEKEFETYNTAKVIVQNYFALGIIADIAKEVQTICREENIFLIADSSHFLNRIIDQNDTPFIYEKIGTRFQNFMIDEFQDTSKLQWLNFKPLVDNSLSNNETSLIVGDVKQSIYRWRNSDWNLLDHKVTEDFKQHGNQQKTLDKNWRSLSNIIKFNNSVFKLASNYLQSDFNSSMSECIKNEQVLSTFKNKISNAYLDVLQEIPGHKQDNKGYIQSRFFEPVKDISYNEQILPEMVNKIEEFLNKGYSYSDFCILVRKKGEGEIIANALLSGNYSQNGNIIPVVSNESLFLSGSSAINFIMAQVKYLLNPNNLVLKADMALNKHLLEGSNDDDNIEIGKYFDYEKSNSFADKSIPWVDELLNKRQKPLLELIEYLANQLPDKIKEEQGIFIQAFINCTNQFIKDHFPDLSAFIDWWEDKGKSEAIAVPDDQDAIQIMTVHKSKGLEFKIVLIPFCNWKLDAEINSNIIWCAPYIEPFNDIRLLPVTYNSKLKNTIFKEEYFEEKLYQYVDSLNLLYVAFTRSCEALITYGPTPSKSSKNGLKSVSDLLYFIFNNGSFDKNKEGFLDLNYGWNEDDKTFTYGEISENSPQDNNDSEIVSEVLKPFSHNALTQMVFEGKLTEEEKTPLISEIKRLIEQDNTRRWFDPLNVVKAEKTIITPNGAYRPDRVVFFKNEIHVIDYKFGDKVEKKYGKQVIQYIRQIKSMGHKSVKGFIWYVTLDRIDEISPEAIQGNLF
jgi:ATP-dependent exoDNAse (exonuclease V) beta subunit